MQTCRPLSSACNGKETFLHIILRYRCSGIFRTENGGKITAIESGILTQTLEKILDKTILSNIKLSKKYQ